MNLSKKKIKDRITKTKKNLKDLDLGEALTNKKVLSVLSLLFLPVLFFAALIKWIIENFYEFTVITRFGKENKNEIKTVVTLFGDIINEVKNEAIPEEALQVHRYSVENAVKAKKQLFRVPFIKRKEKQVYQVLSKIKA